MTNAREQAREAAASKYEIPLGMRGVTDSAADAASDVWEPLLRKFGRHDSLCSWGLANICTCGLKEVLG